MAKLGIVKGRAADSFVPDAFITRAEFAAICARFDNSEYEVVDDFTDAPGAVQVFGIEGEGKLHLDEATVLAAGDVN